MRVHVGATPRATPGVTRTTPASGARCRASAQRHDLPALFARVRRRTARPQPRDRAPRPAGDRAHGHRHRSSIAAAGRASAGNTAAAIAAAGGRGAHPGWKWPFASGCSARTQRARSWMRNSPSTQTRPRPPPEAARCARAGRRPNRRRQEPWDPAPGGRTQFLEQVTARARWLTLAARPRAHLRLPGARREVIVALAVRPGHCALDAQLAVQGVRGTPRRPEDSMRARGE